MPLVAIVQNRFFCVHGGLGRAIRTVNQIEDFVRPIVDDLKPIGVKALLWADPSDSCPRFGPSPRGGDDGRYGYLAVRDFLQENSLEYIIRAHECVDAIRRSDQMPVITVFSASNYDAGMPNRSGVIEIDSQGEQKHYKYPPLERMKRVDASFFTFGRHKGSENSVVKSPSLGRGMPARKASGFLFLRASSSLLKRGSGLNAMLYAPLAALGSAQSADDPDARPIEMPKLPGL
jgi:diadenosine tetraphosphatase ApaH/serine/threonine PP2A family protein phosphatase